MVNIEHLPSGADTPAVAPWVVIRRIDGRYFVTKCDPAAQASLTIGEGLESFETGVHQGKAFAKELGVQTVYAIGCDNA